MEFFQQLAQIAPGIKLDITVMEKDGIVAVSIIPNTTKKLEAIQMSGPAAEIDANIVAWLTRPMELVKAQLDTELFEKSLKSDNEGNKPAPKEQPKAKPAEKKDPKAKAAPAPPATPQQMSII